MKRNNKSIYDKLDELKAPIDKNQTWDAIYNRDGFPREEKRRRFTPWYFFGFGLLILLSGIAIIHYNKSSHTLEKKIAQRNNSASSNTDVSESTDAKILVPSNSKNIENKTSFTKKSTESIAETKIKILNNSKHISNIEIAEKENDVEIENTPHTPYPLTKSSNSSNNIDFVNTSKLKTNKSVHNPNQIFIINRNSFEGQNLHLPSKKKLIRREAYILPILPLQHVLPSTEKLNTLKKKELTKNNPPTPLRLWAIELGFGIGSGRHAIANDTTFLGQNFQTENTKSLASYSLDLRVSRNISPNWRAAMSLRYAKHRRLFSYDDISKIYFKQENPNPHNYFESTISSSYAFYQNHELIDLEAILIRDFNWNKNSIYLGLGAGFNVLYNFEGSSINSQLTVADLQSRTDFKDSLGWHYLYEIGYSRQLYKRFDITFSLSGRSKRILTSKSNHSIQPLYFRLGTKIRL